MYRLPRVYDYNNNETIMTNNQSPTAHTADNRYAEDLLALCQPLFANLLLADSKNDDTWAHRIETLNRCELLTHRVPSIFKPKPLDVDQSRIDDSRYRRWLARKLLAPRPGKWMSVRLEINRLKLEDSNYRRDIGKLIAHKWLSYLIPSDSSIAMDLLDVCVLARLLNESTLAYCLDNLRLNDLLQRRVVPTLMRLLAEELVDGNEAMRKCLAQMRCETAAAVAEAQSTMRALAKEHIERGEVAIRDITVAGATRLDKVSAEISRSLAESAAKSQKTLAECAVSGECPDVEFRRALEKREREHKEAYRNSKEKWVWRVGFTAFAVVVTFFFEFGVDGITPAEALVDWARWLVPAD